MAKRMFQPKPNKQARLDIRVKAGFTLIELSIVLVIIGLLVGGLLLGRELIDAAAVRGTISQIDQYKVAYSSFRLKYDCVPGDCKNASEFGLPAGYYHGVNGNGDGRIYSFADATTLMPEYALSQMSESWGAGTHLAAAGLVGKSYTYLDASTTSNLRIPGGYIWFSSLYPDSPPGDYTLPDSRGNYLYIGTFAQNTGSPGTSYPVLTVQQAYSIDVKLDDGLPMSGYVRASTWYNTCMGNSMPNGAGACFNSPYRTSHAGLYGATLAESAPVDDAVTPAIYHLDAPLYTGATAAYHLLTKKLSIHIRLD